MAMKGASDGTLQMILDGLSNKDKGLRKDEAVSLRKYISKKGIEQVKELTVQLNRELFNLLASKNRFENLGAISALIELLDIPSLSSDLALNLYAKNLLSVFPPLGTDAEVMEEAASALGELASRVSGPMALKMVQMLADKVLEWLEHTQIRNEHRRLASVLILHQLALHQPSNLNSYIPRIFTHIFPIIHDPNVNLRESGVQVLSQCLQIWRNRSLYPTIYGKIESGFKDKKEESIHGSLLAAGEFVDRTGDYTWKTHYFEAVCDAAIMFSEHKSPLIQRAIVDLLPRLAKANKEEFVAYQIRSDSFCTIVIQHVVKLLKERKHYVFLALGDLSTSVTVLLLPYLDKIMSEIIAILTRKGKNITDELITAVCVCITKMTRALCSHIAPYITTLIDPLVALGVNEASLSALHEIVESIPDMQHQVQLLVLTLLSTVLQCPIEQASPEGVSDEGAVFVLPTTPALPITPVAMPPKAERPIVARTDSTSFLNKRKGSVGKISATPVPSIYNPPPEKVFDVVLALKMLRVFRFYGLVLTRFARDCVLNYVASNSSLIREEASKTCAELLVPNAPHEFITRRVDPIHVVDVLKELLTIAISEPESRVRCCLVDALPTRLDPYLAHTESLQLLFILLQDSHFALRIRMVNVLGRLVVINPASVMPAFRTLLIHLLAQLEIHMSKQAEDEVLEMLTALIKQAPRIVKPYMHAILNTLIPKITNPSRDVSMQALIATGELATIVMKSMRDGLPSLLPPIMAILRDQSASSNRKQLVLHVLGQLCQNSAEITLPYSLYPDLLSVLVGLLSDKHPELRAEAVRVIGILGALDPYVARKNMLGMTSDSAPSHRSDFFYAPGSEEYYQELVIKELMALCKESTLSFLHDKVVRVSSILVTRIQTKCVPYLPQIIPTFLGLLPVSDAQIRQLVCKELGKIVGVVGIHIRSYAKDIIASLIQIWLPTSETNRITQSSIHIAVVGILKALALALSSETKLFISDLVTHVMGTLSEDQSNDRAPTKQALEGLTVLAPHLGAWRTTVIYTLLSYIHDFEFTFSDVRRVCVMTLTSVIRTAPVASEGSRIVNILTKVLRHEAEMRTEAMDCLVALIWGMGQDFEALGHLRVLEMVVASLDISDPRLKELSECLYAHESFESCTPLPLLRHDELDPVQPSLLSLPRRTKAGNSPIVALALDAASSPQDWGEWIQRFTIALIRESSSPAIASCQELNVHEPFVRRLFTAAFVSCWVELGPEEQEKMAEGLERAMNNDYNFMQMMLSVADFMTHYPNQINLPISNTVLTSMASEAHAYAKALRYREADFSAHFDMPALLNGLRPQPVRATPKLFAVVEDLLNLTHLLQIPEAAQGIVSFLQQNLEASAFDTIQPSWYYKLRQYQRALKAYDEKLAKSRSFELDIGRLGCLRELERWDDLKTTTAALWPSLNDDQRGSVSQIMCSSAADLGKWSDLGAYLKFLPDSETQTTLFGAMFALYKDDFTEAQRLIDITRVNMEPLLTSLWNESYSRGYTAFVSAQLLSEMEEVMVYKRGDGAVRSVLQETWKLRLLNCKKDPDEWLRILRIRSLVVSYQEGIDMWLKYASLCKKMPRSQNRDASSLSSWTDRSHAVLVELLGTDPSRSEYKKVPFTNPRVVYAYAKHLYEAGKKSDAIVILSNLINHLSPTEEDSGEDVLLSRCYLRLGEFHLDKFSSRTGKLTEEEVQYVAQHFLFATELDPSSYKAWQNWALVNFNASRNSESVDKQKTVAFACSALSGLFKSISLNTQLQDLLRLLTLWYQYGGIREVSTVFQNGMSLVPINAWLMVIPQLIARISTPDPAIRSSLHDLLNKLFRLYPQSFVFPLSVAAKKSKSANKAHREAAEMLLHRMRDLTPVLVEQATMVSEELIRVAILWSEMWHEGLEEASKHYTDRDFDAMFAVLAPLHQKLEEFQNNGTAREVEFMQLFAKDLHQAWEWCNKYHKSKTSKDLATGWDIYYHVYRNIDSLLKQIKMLDLVEVSPKLLAARDLEVVVPGTLYKSPAPITVKALNSKLTVLNSKQRPRRLAIEGSDGKMYSYLLKAHEDLRQDERVMQLFGLVNALLDADASTSVHHLKIQRYSVLPLAPNLGLIEWVPSCDTFHHLIRDHRERMHVPLDTENKLMIKMAPDYDHLTIIQKVEVFRHALSHTSGDDMARVLWYQSGSSETWLERRTNYTRSLALMSMVGYVLGLGDRHPSNLTIDRLTGNVMHVDFGDCFEVAMHRPRFPEKVPFRLTRMLIAAMEVSGIEGNFKFTCENVLGLLRKNQDSLVAVLEAFVYDPLIDWFSKGRQAGAKKKSSRVMSPAVENESNSSHDQVHSHALDVIKRVKHKLTGQDFAQGEALDVPSQVKRLVRDATNHENLCQHYTGWCPFW